MNGAEEGHTWASETDDDYIENLPKTSPWNTRLPKGHRRLDSFRCGARFRLAHDQARSGKVISKGGMGVYVKLDRFVERTFTTKDGEEVTISKTTEKVTLSSATSVMPYRAQEAT